MLDANAVLFTCGVVLCIMQGYLHCSISSQEIELQYQQNPSGTMMFTTKNFNYELDFSGEL